MNPKSLCLVLLSFIGIELYAQKLYSLKINCKNEKSEKLDLVGIAITDIKSGNLIVSETVFAFPAEYQLENGIYLVNATKFGYFQKTDTVVIEAENKDLELLLTTSVQTSSISGSKAKPEELLPGMVTVITREQIEQIGSRDLADVLRTLAGIDFGVDVFGTVTLMVRGSSVAEGKFLVLLDGMMMNEIFYGVSHWGQRYPVENIERIEILRGAASINAGGIASQGVLNIITRKHTDKNGFKAGSIIGFSDKYNMRNNFSFMYNNSFNKDFALNISGYVGRANRSDTTYTDYLGTTYNMYNQSNVNNEQLLIQLNYKNSYVKLLADNYTLRQRDGYDLALSKAYATKFPILSGEIGSTIKLNNYIQFKPKLTLLNQRSYFSPTTVDSADLAVYPLGSLFDDILIQRSQSSGKFLIQPNKNILLTAMAEYTNDFFLNNYVDFSMGGREFSYSNLALIGTADIALLGANKLNENKALDLFIGLRYDKQTFFDAFVPQIGVNFLWNKLYAKAIAGQSFKAPLAANLLTNAESQLDRKPNIKPEFINNFETEIGLNFNSIFKMSLNAYYILTQQTIQYVSFPTPPFDNYLNSGNSGTRGIEISVRLKTQYVRMDLNYGTYNAHTQDTFYKLEDQNLNFGFSRHKLFANLVLDLEKIGDIKGANFSINYIYSSPKNYFNPLLDEIRKSAQRNILNVFLNVNNVNKKGLNFGAGIQNILGQRQWFYVPYYSSHMPLPGTSREYVIRLSFDF